MRWNLLVGACLLSAACKKQPESAPPAPEPPATGAPATEKATTDESAKTERREPSESDRKEMLAALEDNGDALDHVDEPAAVKRELDALEDPWLQETLFTLDWPKWILAYRIDHTAPNLVLTISGMHAESRKKFSYQVFVGEDMKRLDAPVELDRDLRTEAVSPDGHYSVRAEDTVLRLTDRKTKTTTTVASVPYTGDWSIAGVSWGLDGKSFYFDNAGAAACIWRYEIASKSLTKIVPEHDAAGPRPVMWRGQEYVVYSEGAHGQTQSIKAARALSKSERSALEKGASANLSAFAGKWTQVSRRGDDWVLRKECFEELAWVEFDAGASPKLTSFDGHDAYPQPIDAALYDGASELVLVEKTKAGGFQRAATFYLEQGGKFLRRGSGEAAIHYVSEKHRGSLEVLDPGECEMP